MKNFTQLFEELDSTTSTNEKIEAVKKFLRVSDAEDSMWMILLLTGKTSGRVLTSATLRKIFLKATDYPIWLFEECRQHVGDTAETVSLLLNSLGILRDPNLNKNSIPQESSESSEKLQNLATEAQNERSLTTWLTVEIPRLASLKDENEQAAILLQWWQKLTFAETFILSKLMTGAFRVGVSDKTIIRAVAEVYNLPTDQVAHRLTGKIESGADAFAKLISQEKNQANFSQPYPFCLAHVWLDRKEQTWNPSDWCVEWKYDGIRSQVIRRDEGVWIWSRGEDDITNSFPELKDHFQQLPQGTVLDGEILVIKNGEVQSFQELQKRLGRKKVPAAILKAQPVGFVAYDILEHQGQDIRALPLRERKALLKEVMSHVITASVQLSEVLSVKDSETLENLRGESRLHRTEGVMIKAWESAYVVGRKTGTWWKHKVEPLALDAVLLYAQAGTGRRANLYTDYTFALWDQSESENGERKLVPFAKAYSGLNQAEIDELDHWIRRHTKEKFGPVRSLEPHFVFEIGFEGILKSTRHKSGIAVRFPRILRWRKDKKPEDADLLVTAFDLLETEQNNLQPHSEQADSV